MKARHILGLNARSIEYLKPLNNRKGRRIADSKLLTKKVLKKHGLPAPGLLKVFRKPQSVEKFDWLTLPDNFVLKPSSGYGGEGIVVVKKKAKFAGEWYLMDNSKITVADLKFRVLDILAGKYSLHGLPDKALIEERIKIARIFRKYAFQGTPDIRIIVFNKIPVMAMLRLPTAQSKGKANLHQGAIGVGIDLATGITTYGIATSGIYECRFLKYVPGTKRKINGLKIPKWNTILTLAVKCQEAIPSLGFLGVDLFFDKKHGPVIVELNTRPGLWVQMANYQPLRKRLERVEGLQIKDAAHGVKVARTLFAERFADRVMAEEGVKILKTWEIVKVRSADKKRVELKAKIDTGAWRSSIDRELARELGLLKPGNVIFKKVYKSGLGKGAREAIELTFFLAGRRVRTVANVSDRAHLRAAMIIGRRDLSGFLVKPRR